MRTNSGKIKMFVGCISSDNKKLSLLLYFTESYGRKNVYSYPLIYRSIFFHENFVRGKFLNQKLYSHYFACKSHPLIHETEKIP
jgi:hypothetical protein